MEETRSFAPLLLVLFLAFLVPLLVSRIRRFRLPIVVGEILAGILIGRSGFGWVQQHDPVLDLMAEFGFAFLFFLAGTEIDFSSFIRSNEGDNETKNPLKSPLSLAIISYGLTLILALVAAYFMQRSGFASNAWMLALIFSPSALGIIVAVLKEGGFGRNKLGQAILTAALVADFGTLLLFTISVAIISRGLTLEILLVGLLFVAFFLMYRSGDVFFNRIPAVRRIVEELSTATAQIKVRAAFTLLLIFVVLSEIIGTEIVLGAFLAGAVVSLLTTPKDAEALHQLEAIGFGFFIPIFFIMIGVDFELSALLESRTVTAFNIPQALLLVPIMLAVTFGVKYIPALIFRTIFGWRETLAIGTLLSARLSLIVAESAIVLTLGLIDPSVNAAVILTALLLATLSPVLFNRIAPKVESEKLSYVVITGAGELGVQVAEQMQAHNENVVLLDPDEARISRALMRGLNAVLTCVDQRAPESEPYLKKARILVNMYSDIELNYRICQLARNVYNIDHVVTRVAQPSELARYERLGVAAINPAVDQASLLVMVARNPAIYELLTRTDDNRTVYEITVSNTEYIRRDIRSIQLPGDVLVLALRRNGELIVPRGNTQLEIGDHLTLMGSLEAVEEAKYKLS